MDLHYCTQCGQRIAAGDRFCRSCGQAIVVAPPPAPTPPSSKNRSGLLLLVILIGLIALGALVTVLNSGSLSPAPMPHDDAIGAYVMCEQFVTQRLKAPSTAKFAGYTGSTVTKTGAQSYQVVSYVDAQNSFGAQLRITFTCLTTNYDGDNWRLDKLSTSED